MLNPEPELNLDMIDFEWVAEQKKPKMIKKALKILEEDGNHFTDLQKALQDKLEELDPTEKTKKPSKVIDPEILKSYQEGIFEWEEEKKKKEAERDRQNAQQKNSQNIFETDVPKFKVDPSLSQEQRAGKAEAEKTKGNEALRSGDYKEALTFYSKSIQYNDKAAATFCNRALVYLKLKDYKSCISDADKALQLQPGYSKALHRRGKAYFHLNSYQEAIKDFQEIMTLEPNNAEVNADLMETRRLLEKDGKPEGDKSAPLEKKGGFKKIAIQEEDESDEEDKPVKANPVSTGILEVDRIIDTAFIEEQTKALEDKLKNLEAIKVEGNTLFKNSQYETAIKKFDIALHKMNEILLSGVPIPAEKDLPNQKASILNNIALCYVQMDLPSKVVEYSGLTIDVATSQDISIKAYLRRALAYEKLDKLVLSLHDYEAVKNLHPDNKQASEGLNRIHQLMKNDPELKKKLEKSRDEKQKEEAKKAEAEKKAAEQKPAEQKPAEQKPVEQKPVEQKAPEKKSEPQQAPKEQQSSKKSEPAPLVLVDHAALEAKKATGNELFKQKNLPRAKETFVEIVNKVEQYYSQNISQEDRQKLNALYVAVLSNTALVSFNLNDFEECLKYCEKALVVEANHAKCLYRKALSKIKISEQLPEKLKSLSELDVKQEQVLMYDEARKILEALLKTDNKNEDIKAKLLEVIGVIVKIRKNFNLAEKKEVPKPKIEEVQEETKTNTTTLDNKPKVIAGMKTEQLEKVKDNVIKIATEELIQSVDIPENHSQLELNCKTFKNQPDKLFTYLKKIPADKLAALYSNYGIDPDFVMNIVKGMKATRIKEDADYSLALLREIATKSCNFHLCAKQLSTPERKEIKQVVSGLEENATKQKESVALIFEKYNCKDL